MNSRLDARTEQLREVALQSIAFKVSSMLDVRRTVRLYCEAGAPRLAGEADIYSLCDDIEVIVTAAFLVAEEVVSWTGSNEDDLEMCRATVDMFLKFMSESFRRYNKAVSIVTSGDPRRADPAGVHDEILPDAPADISSLSERDRAEMVRFMRGGAGHYLQKLVLLRMVRDRRLRVVELKYAPVWDHLVEKIAAPPRLSWRSRAMLVFIEAARVLGVAATKDTNAVFSAFEMFLSQVKETQRVEQVVTSSIIALGHDGGPYQKNHLVNANKKRSRSDKKVWLAQMGAWPIARLASEGPMAMPA